MIIDIKPMSVNDVWQGRRFKTPEYKKYERDIMLLLKPLTIPEGDLLLNVEFGFSSKASDIDNPVKPFLDCLQKKYGFNDKRIKKMIVSKEHVSKGNEYIYFNIEGIRCKD